ncbi:MAG: selenium metabolism-associated LysR family transcriptional regulator [Desulfobulbus sp.]|jgi:DNA-binding transcriptional LysR family regulator
MTLKQIEVFLAVAENRSFSKGGEALSLAQSTASQHVRALEEELGVCLFDRHALQVGLTEVGRVFYEQAARIVTQCDEAVRAVRRFQGLEQATLRVGASTIPAVFLIPDMLGRFSADWPGICLELRQGSTRDVLRMLNDDLVELAVVGGKPNSEAVTFQEIAVERIVLVASPKRFQVGRLTVEQLTGLPLIQREPGSATQLAAETALAKIGVEIRKLRVVAQLAGSEAVRRAVLSGAGYAFLSAMAVRSELADGSLEEASIAGLDIRRSFYLAWKRGRRLSPAAEKFEKAISRSAAEQKG